MGFAVGLAPPPPEGTPFAFGANGFSGRAEDSVGAREGTDDVADPPRACRGFAQSAAGCGLGVAAVGGDGGVKPRKAAGVGWVISSAFPPAPPKPQA